MNPKKSIVIAILCALPVLFVLVLLAMIHVLLLFVGIAAVLIALLAVKRVNPKLFDGLKIRKQPEVSSTHKSEKRSEKDFERQQVYMVLIGRDTSGARRIAVNKTSYSIGRGEGNDFVLDDKMISRNHLRIEFDENENVAYAIDLGSSNGSFLNSERMVENRRYRLAPGDRLMLDDRMFDVSYAHY